MEKIFGYIDQNLDRFLNELFVLLRQPSISARWEGVEECSRLLAGMMEKTGIRPRLLPMGGKRNSPLIYGEVVNPEAKRTLLIYGHYDVQPPEPRRSYPQHSEHPHSFAPIRKRRRKQPCPQREPGS